jgi:hypothetical protein
MEETKNKYVSQDDLEYICALAEGYEGYLRLSSQKLIYVNQPRKSPEEIGSALRAVHDRMIKEKKGIL